MHNKNLKKKQDEIQGLNDNLGDSDASQKRLNEQIKQLTTQKIQLEAKEKKINRRS